MDKVLTRDNVSCRVRKKTAGPSEDLKVAGYFTVRCRDAAGNLKWEEGIHNLITTEGLNMLMDVGLGGVAASGTWYLAPYTTGAPALGNSYATPVLVESTNYDEANRVTWVPQVAVGGSVTAASSVAFTWNATDTLNGLMVVNVATKGDTVDVAGIMYSQGAFQEGAKSLVATDVIDVNYTCTVGG